MKKLSVLGVSVIILLVFLIALTIRIIPAIYTLELKTIDWRFSWRGKISVEESPIVLVTIDDQSFESLPSRWPWPREYYAHVVENLIKAEAKVIGIDVILDVADRDNVESDQRLANVIKESGKVVLAGKITYEHRNYPYLTPPAKIFQETNSDWGIVSSLRDQDGIIRQYLTTVYYQDSLLPSFGLQVIRKYLDLPEDVPIAASRNTVTMSPIRIPLTEEGLMRICFAGPAFTFPNYSFETVIDDEQFDLGDFDLNYFTEDILPDKIFKDKIVLVGSTVDELHDNFPTPFFEYKDRKGKNRKVEMPGVEIHANAIWTILNNYYFKEIPNHLSIFIILLLIIFIYVLVLRLSTGWSIVFGFIILFGYNVGMFYLFSNSRWIVEIVSPSIAIVLSFVASNLHQYVITQREKKMIIGAFERFVPQKVVKELLANPEKLQLGGEERFLSVLFLDLADFTSVSEKLKPSELVNLINAYLTEMTDIVLKYDGIIDKFEGDAIMAEFGAPVYFEDHAIKACYSALEMQEKLAKLNLSRYKKIVTKLSCRIGINSGDMIVGNMGSKNVFDYTVMGDAVNLASRLEGANKLYKTNIMISEDTYNLVKDVIISRPLDLIRVKGREKPVRVMEVISRKDAKIRENVKSMLPIFVNGVRYYHLRDWKKSRECFEYCKRIVPEDGPSQIYFNRIEEYSQNPPPEDWDGVFTMQTK
jgi:adenylate cyclase